MTKSSPTYIGLLGGSFNPAHDGHRQMSLYALQALGLDEVWWLVSPQNPLKSAAGMQDYRLRLKKARSVARHPRIKVSDVEARQGTRYTVDTLRTMQPLYPAAKFVWLMGADNMLQIARWKNWRALFRMVPVAVFRRAPYSADVMRSEAAQTFAAARVTMRRAAKLAELDPPAWILCDNRLNGISATKLRREQKRSNRSEATWQSGKRKRSKLKQKAKVKLPSRPAPKSRRKK